MDDRYRDFDSYWAEQESEPIKFVAFGEEYSLPPSLPATVALKIMRLKKEHSGGVPEEELTDLAISLLGEGQLDELCRRGLSGKQLGDLLRWIFAAYTDQDGDRGNAPAPAQGRGESTSSGAGPR